VNFTKTSIFGIMSVAKIVKRFSLVTFPLLFFLTASVYGQSVTRGPYLQKVSDSSIHVLWSTDSLTDSYVFFGTVPASPTQVRFTSSDTNRHNVLIDSLIPNTTYYYAVGNQSGVFDSAVHFHFQTAPAIGSEEALRFWVTGDFGKGNTEQLDVLAAYNNYAGSNIANCWLWLGDNAYEDGTESDYQANVFDRYDSLMAYTPFFSTPGNHDYRSVSGAYVSHHSTHTGPYYDIVDVPISAELGGYPSSTEAYYSFNYGNAHFVSLNSEVQSTGSVNSDMEAWLHQDLSSDTSLWKIVFTHQPPYSKGSYDSDLSWELVIRGIRENYLPIFDQHDVDLILTGHSHAYERSLLIKEHYDVSTTLLPAMIVDGGSGDPNLGETYVKYTDSACAEGGAVYCIMGNSGSKTGFGNDKGLNHPVMHFSEAENSVGSLVLDIHGDTLLGTYLRETGAIPDKFRILKSACPTDIEVVEPGSFLFKPYNDYGKGEISVRIDISNRCNLAMKLYDMNGEKVYTHDFGTLPEGKHFHSLNTSSFSTGMYLMVFSNGNRSISKKVFKLNF